ncbi:ATP-binding protein [Candidatus Dependentiae bacterium]|nr:ATP-binding protein [Candidatus Dependentiae bacterium]
MIAREITGWLSSIAKELPVLAIVGPRQSGKTTVSRATFPNHRYISLEDLDHRAHARQDPRDFLAYHQRNNEHGIILDEIQHAPELLSYMQTIVDENNRPGYFIVTGSQNFLVHQAITQTLAGRIAIFTLLPLAIPELTASDIVPATIEELVFKGSYPRLYAHDITIPVWYASYVHTYIERDVREITTVKDLTLFQLFMKLCAGRIGQLLNVSALATECGITQRTANEWLNLLQASYIIFLVRPHYKNFNKRLVKTAKLYFYDTGLACSLLEIDSVQQLHTHYLRGSLVECLVMADFAKQLYNRIKTPHIYFWRDNHGHEIDCLLEQGTTLLPIEIKAGKTITSDYFTAITYWINLANSNPADAYIVYGGSEGQQRSNGTVLSWRHTAIIINRLLTNMPPSPTKKM